MVDRGGDQGTEIYPDGTNGCHREYGYRPDAKMSGSYTLPWDIQLAGTYQFTRGVQTGGAGPSIDGKLGGDERGGRLHDRRARLDRRGVAHASS